MRGEKRENESKRRKEKREWEILNTEVQEDKNVHVFFNFLLVLSMLSENL